MFVTNRKQARGDRDCKSEANVLGFDISLYQASQIQLKSPTNVECSDPIKDYYFPYLQFIFSQQPTILQHS